MVDLGRQAWLNGESFETLAGAIAHKDANDVAAIISFDDDAVTGQRRPADLLHDEIETLRATSEFECYVDRHPSAKPEHNARQAEELMKGMGRNAAIDIHDSGVVTANAIFADPSEQERIQNEVDELLQSIQRKYSIVRHPKKPRSGLRSW